MKRSNKTIIGSIAFLLFMISILGAVSTSIFNIDFYTKSQTKHNVANDMNLSQKEVTDATIVAFKYSKGEIVDLSYMTKENGKTTDLYSVQDKEHMIDVKNLYFGMTYTLIAVVVLLFALLVLLFLKRRQTNLFGITLIINKVSMYSLIIVGIIALFAFVNFEQFWIFFHKVFFTNDLWLMDFNKDALVNLFPEGLFMDLVYKIIFRFALIFGSINVIAYLYRFYNMRRISND